MPTSERKTALITGASFGIGMELARIFAREGYSLVLVARSADKLRQLASELEKSHGTRSLILAVDLTEPGASAYVLDQTTRADIQVDVLVNPRLPLWGRDNSFPSKIFEFAMTGKAILSTRACGVDKVLKEAGIYADANNLESSLRQKFREVSAMNRDDLQRRGAIIRQSILNEYNWDAQARRIIEFLEAIVRSPEHSQPATRNGSA